MVNSNFNKNTEMWMIRAGSNSFLIEYFLIYGIVAIGWDIIDLNNKTKTEIKSLIQERYTYKTKSIITRYTNQANNFVNIMNIGDYVITYDQNTRLYFLGRITSDYYYKDIIHKEHPTSDGGYYNHIRNVEWLGEFEKEELEIHNSSSLKNISYIFKIKDEVKENILYLFDENSNQD